MNDNNIPNDKKPKNDEADKRPKNRSRTKKDEPNNSNTRGPKFNGRNKEELSGVIICESQPTPTAQQFDLFHEVLITCAGSRNSKAKGSIRSMKHPTVNDFKPKMPDASICTNADKSIDTVRQTAAMDVWKSECQMACKLCSKHKEDIEGLFETVIGQLGREIRNNLKGVKGWNDMDDDNDTLRLIEKLRELCHQDNNSKVHPVEDLIKKLLRFLQSRQNDKIASVFAEESANKSEVLKSAGGGILSPQVIKHTPSLEHVFNGNCTHAEYQKHSLSQDVDEKKKKEQIEECARQVILAHVIVRGSNDKTHQNLRHELEKDYAKGQNNYPVSATGALDLLNQCKSKTTSRNPRNQREGERNRKTGQEEKDDKPKEEEGHQLTTVGSQLQDSQSAADSKIEHAHQPLLNGAADHEPHNDNADDFCFVQHGVESSANEPPTGESFDASNVFQHVSDDTTNNNSDANEQCNTHNDDSTVTTASTMTNDHVPEDHNNLIADEKETVIVRVDDLDFMNDTACEHATRATTRNNAHFAVKSAVMNRNVSSTNTVQNHVETVEIENVSQVENRSKTQSTYYGDIQGRNDATHAWKAAAARELDMLDRHLAFYPRGWVHELDLTDAFIFAQKNGGEIDPFWILLDSQASCNVTCNPALVKRIRKHPKGNKITIHCNAGSRTINTVADMDGFGMVWFHEGCIANCLSLALVSDRFRVTLDTKEEQAFIVHKDDGESRKFHRASCNLYIHDVRERSENVLVTTAKGKKETYSQRDIKRADRARELQQILMHPSDAAFLQMVDNNLINNCRVTRRDIQMATDIYGTDENVAKGKSARQRPEQLREDSYPVPPEILRNYKNVTLAIDTFHVNGMKFFRSLSRHLMFRASKAISNARQETILKNVERIVSLCAARGFKVTQICGDNEFNAIADDLRAKHGIAHYSVARGAHEPCIKRDNRTVKERCRCVFNSLPFKHWPGRIVIELVMAVEFWLNCWCSSGGISRTIPPRQFLTGIKLDARAHCKYQFGQCIYAQEETDNTMKPRVHTGTCLRPSGNADGGFCAFDVATARRVHGCSGAPAHMTDITIKSIETIAKEQKAPVGLTFGGFSNETTILDLDDRSVVSEDDDNASDHTYDDEEASVETELTGAMTEPDEELSEAGHYETENNAENEGQDLPEAASVDGDEEQEADEDSEPGDIDPHDGSDIEPDEEHNNTADDQEVDNDSNNERAATRTLRSVVRPPKRDEAEGFEGKTYHRQNFFTAGYSNAIKHICKEQHSVMLVSAAIDQCTQAQASQATPQCGAKKGLQIFGKDGTAAVPKEMKQLNDLNVISPLHPRDMSPLEIKRALPYLMFLKRKRCGRIKGRGCADGRSQRLCIDRDSASSPTASLHAIMLMCVIIAMEERHVATADIPGAFLQCDMPEGENVHVRIDGAMAEILHSIDPAKYGPHMLTTRRGSKVICTKANKAICGTLRAALLFWEKLRDKLAEWGFEPNPHDPCTMNKIINGKQATILWYVDDVILSHHEEAVVKDLLDKLNKEFGKVSPLTSTTGKTHEYLGMTIDFTKDKEVRFTMCDYLEDIVANLPPGLKTKSKPITPAGEHLFDIDPNCTKLNKEDAETFHHYVAKLLFAAKRARPDLQTAVAFLCTRVKQPDNDDWKKLVRVIACVAITLFLPLVIGWDGTGNIYWFVDASFAVHEDMKSHTGANMTFGKGSVVSMSTKQKINTKSSTEAEIVAVDDSLPFNIWCLNFLREQGYHSNNGSRDATKYIGHTNILYQDNASSIRLETNGRASSSKRTRHINVRYFLIVDKVKTTKEVSSIEYCPTEEMIADYLTKPLQGGQFRKFRNAIMGITDAEHISMKIAYDTKKLENSNRNE